MWLVSAVGSNSLQPILWHAVLLVHIKSHCAQVRPMDVHARLHGSHKQLNSPVGLQKSCSNYWRRPVSSQTCHSPWSRSSHGRASQCRIPDRFFFCPRAQSSAGRKGSELRASVPRADGISAGAASSSVPGGRDFFTCMTHLRHDILLEPLVPSKCLRLSSCLLRVQAFTWSTTMPALCALKGEGVAVQGWWICPGTE